MKKLLPIIIIWIITIIIFWAIFFYCRNKGDDYAGMGILTGTIVGMIAVALTAVYAAKWEGKP